MSSPTPVARLLEWRMTIQCQQDFAIDWEKKVVFIQVGKWGRGETEDRLFNHPAFQSMIIIG